MNEVPHGLFPAQLGEFVDTVSCPSLAPVQEQFVGQGQDFGVVLRANR